MSAPGPTRAAIKTRDDWETPPEFFELLNGEFEFTLDGAANADNHKCFLWLGPGSSLSSDAFDWDADNHEMNWRIWCNPPYGNLARWVSKFAEWRDAGHIVVALLPNATDAKWFKFVGWDASEIRLMTGRVQFVGSTSSNPSGSIIAIWRPGPKPTTPHVWVWDWKADLAA